MSNLIIFLKYFKDQRALSPVDTSALERDNIDNIDGITALLSAV